ncbi:MAG: hypothetical protein IKX56_00500 [Muribaculaceae bacterium]|nr:hypothetical protein [Muribaculaceae bacterium]
MGTTSEKSWPMSRRWHDAVYWGIIVLACVVFWVMNCLTPLKEDDMAFTLVEGEWRSIDTLLDVLRSHLHHMTNTNGRLADLVPELFCGLLGKGAFNVCNALVFGLLAHLLSLLSTHRRSILAVTFFFAAVGTCFPVPGETMLWVAGSANYMWAVTLSLLLVYCLQRWHGKRLTWGHATLLLLLSVIAGGFNEATSFGFFGGLCLYYVFNPRRFDRRAVVALVGYLIGILFIVTSPAAWDRAADGGIVLNLPFSELVKTRCYIFNEKLWQYYLPAAAVAVGLIAIVLKRGRAVRQCVWTWVFLCLTLELLALGIYHERAYAAWFIVAFIIVTMAADAVLQRWRWARLAVILVLAGLSVFTFARGVMVLRDYKTWNDEITLEIKDAPSQAVLRERHFDGYSRFIKLMNYKSDHFFAHELMYRTYYGKKNVQFVSDSVHVRFHEGRLLDGAHTVIPQSDRPDLAPLVYTFDDQKYIAVRLKVDSLPNSFQTARYYAIAGNGELIDPDESELLEKHGISLDYTPLGFYPLEYQGQCYFICAPHEVTDCRIVFPLTVPPDPEEITLEIRR